VELGSCLKADIVEVYNFFLRKACPFWLWYCKVSWHYQNIGLEKIMKLL